MKLIRSAMLAVLLAAVIALAAGCGKSEPVTDFKTGAWISDDGKVSYVFAADGESGTVISNEDGTKTGFTYEFGENNSCVFHMGGVEDTTRASVVFGDADHATITWEYGSSVALRFVTESISVAE